MWVKFAVGLVNCVNPDQTVPRKQTDFGMCFIIGICMDLWGNDSFFQFDRILLSKMSLLWLD